MTKIMKRVKAAVLVCVLLMGAICVPGQMDSVEAAKPYMKKQKVKWDIKNNKSITIKTDYWGVGVRNSTFKMGKVKKTKASKEGYNKLTCTIKFTMPKLSSADIHKATHGREKGWAYFLEVIDYDTGCRFGFWQDKNQLNKKLDVTVKPEEKYIPKPCKDNDGCVFEGFDLNVKMTIIYPENYKGLCLAVGGYKYSNSKGNSTSYWKGKKPLVTLRLYDKNNFHFKRLK